MSVLKEHDYTPSRTSTYIMLYILSQLVILLCVPEHNIFPSYFSLSRYSGFSSNVLLYALLVNLSASLFLSLGIHLI